MLTKLMAVVVMTGALGVAGHALVSEFGCPFTGGCCNESQQVKASSSCCSTEQTSDCCSVSRSACCLAASSSGGAFVYSECTGQVHLVQQVDGGYQCVLTGEMLDECCVVPLAD